MSPSDLSYFRWQDGYRDGENGRKPFGKDQPYKEGYKAGKKYKDYCDTVRFPEQPETD